VLAARAAPYRIDTLAGAIDGVGSPGHRGRGFHFANVTIAPGARVIVSGELPLVLLATGSVTVAGDLVGDGQAGADARLASGGAAGRGGPGGAAGGRGGGTVPGHGRAAGERGRGSGGGHRGAFTPNPLGPAAVEVGGGASHATKGEDAAFEPRTVGGPPYGSALISPLAGGSGGGGGGIRDVEDIGQPGNGGGGAGGAILLQARGQIAVGGTAVVTATGGPGGVTSMTSMPRPGGNGGDGRIRFEDGDGSIAAGGTAATGVLPLP